jgi:hypothetical protein
MTIIPDIIIYMGIGVHQFKDIFSEEDLKAIHRAIDGIDIPIVNGEYVNDRENSGVGVNKELGRLQFGGLHNIDNINDKLYKIVNEISDIPLLQDHVMAVEYNGKYGTPVLPPHFDHDTNDLVVDFQLSANTSWDLGVDLKNYEMLDNSALIFNANEHIHWRPHKTFKEGEYVRMVFWRFYRADQRSDYSHLDLSDGHEILAEANKARDSLGWS